MFLLIGMIGMFSVPLRADEIQIGSGSQTDANLPTHSYYKYSLTQQIYTAAEIEEAGGGAGTINSIAFYNGGSTKTRNFSVYLVNTDKESFSNATDWITVSANDLVFSDNVDMTANVWTTITFSNPFSYDGGNLAVVVDDNTGNDISGMACRIFTASSTQSIYYRNDGTNPDPTNPTISGIPTTNKNQVILDIEMASVTCAKPKNFAATNIAAHTATLTWTAGAEGQNNWDVYVTTTATDVPDENTLPTYQVTECTKSLSGLTTQTTYYAYVRSACGGDDGNSKWASTSFTTTREALTIDAENPYSQDFEANNDWSFANGTLTNQWQYGNATHNGNGSNAIYISDDNGATNHYTNNKAVVVYASQLFNFAQGTYTFSFDWNANGESSYDFLRVALVPGDKTFTAGVSLPSGVTASALPSTWIALDGGSKLNQSSDWQNKVAETTLSGTYTMVFLWRNDNSGGNQPPAAIDNISISYMTCPRPTNLTASNVTGRTAVLTWKENGTADNWTLQYATDASFSANLVEISDGFIVNGNNVGYGLTGLNGETKYYVRVKSNCDSSWSDVINFTTTATCEKPTLSYVANSNTAHTGSVSWTGDADGYELIYSTAYTFEPGDEGVTQINLGSVNTYTLQDLDPETTYRIKVRANCGEDDGYSAWSNQVNFTTTATCIKPTGLTASNVTSSTATITWTAGEAGQDTWNLQYKKASESEWQSVTVTTNSYDLNDLSAVSTYDVRVQADCGEGDLSQWTTSSFSTTCGALELPYTYGFEDNLVTTSPYSSSNPFPKCWDRIAYQSGSYGSYTYYPYVFTATTSQPYAHGGNGANTYSGHSLRFYQTSSSTNECAVLPEISNDYNMNSIQIRFWAAVQSSQGNLKIGIMSSPTDANTFVQIEEINVSNTYNNGFQEFTVPFSTYAGNGRYIAFMCGTGSAYAYFLIDDITVEVVPSCLVPDELEASGITENEATLSWTPQGSESAWNIQYKKATDSEWSNPIAVDETTYTLTGLQRATGYEVRVQANCATDDQSDWSNPLSFETECGILPIDAENAFSENFDNVDASDFPPTCWEKFSHEMSGFSYWYLNSNNGLGSSAAYSSWNQGYAFLVMPKMHIDGDAILSFDYLIGSGDYDESCSVVVSTGEMTYNDFDHTIWEATGSNSGNANATISLASFNGQDIYVAFKFKGSGTSGCTWYVDNVQVYVGEIFTKDITAYSGDGGYYLIASPVGEVNPENITNMLSNNYDLYRFNQSAPVVNGISLEWENYKQESFSLEPGKGYLYANDHNVTLQFTGTPYNGESTITLTKTDIVDWSGWNLVGNPFAQTAYITKAFYTMNGTGSEVVAGTGNSIEAMEGIFVIAEQNNEEMTFSTTQPAGQNQQLVINVTHDRGASTRSATTSTGSAAIDRAIVRFDEGGQLPKFQLFESSTKLYIPQGNSDFAIVRSAAEGEMPVNFKASENGTYTISVNTETVEMDYLHLIDNMTGTDVDLQATPSYTFEATTRDYASRFRLVFSANDNNAEGNANFAYFNGSEWQISNIGEATLQVVDVMGRVVKNVALEGNATVSIDEMPGVYMMRLLNGNDVKVQKVVIR